MTKSHVIIFVALISILAGCASTTSKLTKHDATDSTRIIYGKIIDLNPESIPAELQMTYVTEEAPKNGILSFDNKFPRLEPKTNFWWVSVPKDAKYFGVSSIRFKLNGVEGTAIIRDDRTHKPLFGISLQPGNNPIYIGDITIRSGMRKYSAGLETEGFDLKEAYIKDNSKIAREFLDKNGIDSNELVVTPFKLKNTQEAKVKTNRRNGRF